MLAGVATVLEIVLGILRISKKVGGAATEWVLLWLYILLQVKILKRKEVFKRGVI